MSAKDQRISESTVASIAGNVASSTPRDAAGEFRWNAEYIAQVSVEVARAIVAEVERTAKEKA